MVVYQMDMMRFETQRTTPPSADSAFDVAVGIENRPRESIELGCEIGIAGQRQRNARVQRGGDHLVVTREYLGDLMAEARFQSAAAEWGTAPPPG
jgi:hypothetical protein